ncbi:MAG: hypothetical protein PUI48_06830 [Oscillospiraceae bacterium]|nr:hypothetical protein [Oscillospiraceae bacterium]MDY3792629.1 hypothetical protein [Oscillospiraceae bacterium]MDY6207923.1 hypothetical protein [Oscillospiraceae bacterium]
MNFVNGKDIPLGFGMALAQNSEAMTRFSAMSEEQRGQLIEGTHSVRSKKEMQAYVDRIAHM